MIKIIAFSFLTNLMFYSYGHFTKFENIKNNFSSYNNKSISGVILISFLAVVMNFLIPLDRIFNTIVLIFSLIFFFYLKKNNYKKKEFLYIVISSLITASLIIYSTVNRPDAGLYHLPYISILNENKIILGLSNVHFRFGHVSIIQYLSAINNNLIFRDLGIVIPLASIVTFFLIFFFNEILKIFKNKNDISVSKIFCLFIVIFISFKINRYSSFGNDAVAHLSFFYVVAYILKNKEQNLSYIFLLSVFTFINKPTLFLIFLAPLMLFIMNFNYKNFKLFFSVGSFLLIVWLIKNILVSGCAIYPAKQTCLKNLSWVDNNEIITENISGEAWAKAWPDRKNKDISMTDYNKNFEWFSTWKYSHGIYLGKVLIPYTILIFFILYFISKKSKFELQINLNKNKYFFICFLISLLGTLFFFLKFPLFRYGYSYIISLLILSSLFFVKNYSKDRTVKIAKIVFFLCIATLLTKQGLRYIKKHESRPFWPSIYSFSEKKIKVKKISLTNEFHIYEAQPLCMYSKSPCTNYKLKDIKLLKKYGFFILTLAQD